MKRARPHTPHPQGGGIVEYLIIVAIVLSLGFIVFWNAIAPALRDRLREVGIYVKIAGKFAPDSPAAPGKPKPGAPGQPGGSTGGSGGGSGGGTGGGNGSGSGGGGWSQVPSGPIPVDSSGPVRTQ